MTGKGGVGSGWEREEGGRGLRGGGGWGGGGGGGRGGGTQPNEARDAVFNNRNTPPHTHSGI